MQNVREYSNDELVALVPLPADDANKYSRGTLAAICLLYTSDAADD